MNDYVYSIVSFSLAMGIILMLAPDGLRRGLKKHVKLVGALSLVCILINPMSELLNTLDKLSSGDVSALFGDVDSQGLHDKYEKIYEGYLDGRYGENIGDAVKDALFEKFEIKKENCRVLTELSDNEELGISVPGKITVVLSGIDKFRDPGKIKTFLSSLFECEVAVAIE